ncbi:hypothetical protein HAZT_HAZT003291 [Hyalella azteca]|nr:hypothetical protein HAZT_HAZT003291 [Hyalella azteca]
MLGQKELIELLVSHNAPVKSKNSEGWSTLAEAISYGDRDTITLLLQKLKQQSKEAMDDRRPQLINALSKMDDFYMELKWDFQSWVPLVSRMLPSDVCRIHKKGASLRLDTTLVDFNNMRWERGDISFLFTGQTSSGARPAHSLTVIDNTLRVYQRVRHEECDAELEDEVNIMMSSDIVSAQMSMKEITFARAQSGWIFRADKKEVVGKYSADFYCLNGLCIDSHKRREHLTAEDLIKNKQLVENLTKGSTSPSASGPEQLPRRSSLPPPAPPAVSWHEYISAPSGAPPLLARPRVMKHNTKTFRATVAMSEEFPLTVSMLLSVLEIIAPFKHFAKLRDFVQMKLPPGFPVKIDIPILPTVSAKITFQEFEFRPDLPDSLFTIPPHYIEDQYRFPDL